MRTSLVAPLVAAALGLGCLAQAADIESGLKIGDGTSAFNVKDITGPSKGKSLCYRWKYGGRPVVSVFARSLSADLASMVKQIDAVVGENSDKKMAAFVVLLSEDADADADKLSKLAESASIENTPLTIFDGIAGPPKYKIAEEADVTVIMWVKGKVVVNHAFAKGKLNAKAVKAVVADTAKILE